MLAQQFINAISLGGVYALFAFGFTLVFGVLNVINLAHGAVFMIGAYAALHAVVQLRLPLLGGIFVAMLVTGVAGWILDKWIRRRAAAGPRCSSDRPADAQTSGVYLAMATLAFGEVVRVVILNAETLTGGALGLNGIPQLTAWYDVALAVGVMLYVLLRLAHSRVGRTMTAISQDELATELMGLNVGAYKLFSFALGAALAGLAGGLNAHFTFFISPNEYGFERGVEILAMGVLGGSGSPWGALIGAVLITLLPELLRGLGHYRPLLNGIILIVIILYSPKGIWDILQSAPRRARPTAAS